MVADKLANTIAGENDALDGGDHAWHHGEHAGHGGGGPSAGGAHGGKGGGGGAKKKHRHRRKHGRKHRKKAHGVASPVRARRLQRHKKRVFRETVAALTARGYSQADAEQARVITHMSTTLEQL